MARTQEQWVVGPELSVAGTPSQIAPECAAGLRIDWPFKLTINSHQLEWGKPVIIGAVLYQ